MLAKFLQAWFIGELGDILPSDFNGETPDVQMGILQYMIQEFFKVIEGPEPESEVEQEEKPT